MWPNHKPINTIKIMNTKYQEIYVVLILDLISVFTILKNENDVNKLDILNVKWLTFFVL